MRFREYGPMHPAQAALLLLFGATTYSAWLTHIVDCAGDRLWGLPRCRRDPLPGRDRPRRRGMAGPVVTRGRRRGVNQTSRFGSPHGHGCRRREVDVKRHAPNPVPADRAGATARQPRSPCERLHLLIEREPQRRRAAEAERPILPGALLVPASWQRAARAGQAGRGR
jgi:hypothetical protein